MKISGILSFFATSAALIFAIVLNILGARHYRRFDLTENREYSLSKASLETLSLLHEPVVVWVLLDENDPEMPHLKRVLELYKAHHSQISVKYINIEQDPLTYVDLRRRFQLGKPSDEKKDDAEIGESAVIVEMRGKPWFIGMPDLFEAQNSKNQHLRSREERALTSAIRKLLTGSKPKLCFTTGHGEYNLGDGSDEGLGFVSELLRRDNYEVVSVDTKQPELPIPFRSCDVVLIVGPSAPFSKDEDASLKTYLLLGGNLLLASGPIYANSDEKFGSLGLDGSLASFGIQIDNNVIFETDSNQVFSGSNGIRFVAEPKAHSVTRGLVSDDKDDEPNFLLPKIIVHFAHSFSPIKNEGGIHATPILMSSELSYEMASQQEISRWEKKNTSLRSREKKGPFILAMASERPKLNSHDLAGPRVVVFGSKSVMVTSNWRLAEEMSGMPYLVGNAISWLTQRPELLFSPEVKKNAAGSYLTQHEHELIFHTVVFYIPGASVFLAFAFFFWRKRSEGSKLLTRVNKR